MKLAQWQDKAQFVNTNARIAISRLNSPQNTFMSQTPTFVTYYHINTEASSRDKGLQNVELLSGDNSGNRFNEIKDVPLYGIGMLELNTDEDEEGIEANVDGNFILPPHIFHPFPDDYFVINHLNRDMIFRVTAVNFDTPNANGFFRCDFELWSGGNDNIIAVQHATIGHYHCVFDNIGTAKKAVIRDDNLVTLQKIHQLQLSLRETYLDKFYDKAYNALMFMRFGIDNYLYDPMLNIFCNKEKVFELDDFGVADCYLFYEERRSFNPIEYDNSIYDRLTHQDLDDLEQIGAYYGTEMPLADVSIFDYNKDRRVKYLLCTSRQEGPFGEVQQEYIPQNFLTALSLRNSADLISDPYELFIFRYMTGYAADLQNHIEDIMNRRMKYDLHTYIFIPMIMYCLKQCYNSIICDTSVVDESLLDDYTIKKGGKI